MGDAVMERDAVGAGAKSGKPADAAWVTPYLMVRDVVAAVAFYEAAFGFGRQDMNPGPDGVPSHAAMTWDDGRIMMGRQGAYGGTTMSPTTSGAACPVTIYVYCPDVDALAARAAAAGAEVRFGPADVFYGDRICHLVDPDGYSWCFATRAAGG